MGLKTITITSSASRNYNRFEVTCTYEIEPQESVSFEGMKCQINSEVFNGLYDLENRLSALEPQEPAPNPAPRAKKQPVRCIEGVTPAQRGTLLKMGYSNEQIDQMSKADAWSTIKHFNG